MGEDNPLRQERGFMRLGRLAKRGVVERDSNGRWRLAGANPTMPPSL